MANQLKVSQNDVRKVKPFSLEYISNFLKDKRMGILMKETGLTAPTLIALRDKKDFDPRLSTLAAISLYIKRNKDITSQIDNVLDGL